MGTYHLSIHKSCDSYTGLPTFSSREIQLDNEQDFLQAKQLCENRQNMAGFWKQTFLPIRPNQLSDLFLPTLMNLVMKTKDWAKNFFAVLAAIIWDVITLPLRLITFLPQVIYTRIATPDEHPLISYLREKGLRSIEVEGQAGIEITRTNRRILEKDGVVHIRLYQKEIKDGGIDKDGELYTLYLTDKEVPFPIYNKSSFFSRTALNGRPLPELANIQL